MLLPGVDQHFGGSPLIAATVRASVQDPSSFNTGRDFSAWIGITPRAHSRRQGARCKISKQGGKQLRTLLIVGATSVLKLARFKCQAKTSHTGQPASVFNRNYHHAAMIVKFTSEVNDNSHIFNICCGITGKSNQSPLRRTQRARS
ncbi:transposase [Mesorhizobium sp.]|uniref:transposase n=1 Tax=Mesorhizobium sp. TaxID=1871066 RepID=UPI00257D59EF|nr:transposase [Mesorhizobium sp.]